MIHPAIAATFTSGVATAALAAAGGAGAASTNGGGALATRLFIALSILLLFAMLAGRLASGKRSLPILKQLFGTGFVFLGAGVAFGPHGLSLVTPEMVPSLQPLGVFCLGWVAFIIGMQCEFRLVARVAPRIVIFTLGQSVLTMLILAVPVLAMGRRLGDGSAGDVVLAALVIGCCAAVSSQALPVFFQGRLSREDRALLSVATGLEDILVLAAAILLMACAGNGGDVLSLQVAGARIGAMVLLGLALGYAFFFFLRERLASAEVLTIGLGVVTLGAGAGHYLHLSAAGLCFIAGVILVNSPIPRKESFYRVLLNAERPIVFLLFLIVGSFLDFARLARWMIVLPLAYAIARIAAKAVAARAMVPIVEGPMAAAHAAVGKDPSKARLLSPWIGLGLASSGPLSVVVAFDYYLVARSPISHIVLWTVVIGVLVGEVLVPTVARLLPMRAESSGGGLRAVSSSLVQKARAAAAAGSPVSSSSGGRTAASTVATPLPPEGGRT